MYVVGTSGDEVNQFTVDPTDFKENVADDGSVDGALFIEVFGDTFTSPGGTLTEGVDF